MRSELIDGRHLARRAVIYIRQSTPHQVLTNQESLRLQYALHQRARDLGWDETGIQVIDTDLGLSGATATHREGFRDLIARVTLGEVGLVLSSEVTRLARNCSDWYPLLDLCGYRQCLIGDRDGVYDPGSANGRLLLGLKGAISEVELHTLRGRLTAGLLSKAERGLLSSSSMVGQQMAVSFGIKLDASLVNGAVEVIRAGEGLMSEGMPLQVAPDPFNIVQLRGVFRQPLDREPMGARREGSAACLTRVDRAVVEDKHDGLEHYPELGTIAPINLLQQSNEVRASFGPAGAHDELATSPIEHAEHRYFGALARGRNAQVGPLLGPDVRQIRMGEHFGLVAEQKHDVARLGLGLEQLSA